MFISDEDVANDNTTELKCLLVELFGKETDRQTDS